VGAQLLVRFFYFLKAKVEDAAERRIFSPAH